MVDDDSTAKEMDRLVTHFEGVLETLNTNIFRYRESKAAEFTALYEEQLAGTAKPVAKEVRKAIQASIGKFPELDGFTIDPVTPMRNPSSNARHSRQEQQAPPVGPSVPPEQEVSPVRSLEPSRTIHPEERREHESDLAGVVIPGYLPLLDAAKQQQQLVSDLLPQMPWEHQPEISFPVATHTSSQSAPEPSTPEQCTTSPTLNDSTRRRSALRRSASASKSPRKVRFDVGPGCDDGDDSGGKEDDRHLTTPDGDEGAASGSGSSSRFAAPCMLDDPDEAPPPKKVSSVERLRKLGRHPYKSQEESDADAPAPISLNAAVHKVVDRPDSTWTDSKQEMRRPKNPQSGIGRLHLKDSSSDNEEGVLPEINVKKFKKMRSSSAQSSTQTSPTSPVAPGAPFNQASLGPPAPDTAREDHIGPMPKGKAAAAHAIITSTLEKVKYEQPENITNKPGSRDDDELFMFEDDEGISRAKPNGSAPPAEEDTGDDLEEEGGETTAPESTKPAVPMAKSTQSTQSPARVSLLSDGIGSYKGHVLKMPVVKDASVYAEAESLGDFNTFVGGIDGTSGMDEGDLGSFMASVGPLTTGTPKSFSGRLLMEDARLAMRGQQRHNFGSLPVQPRGR